MSEATEPASAADAIGRETWLALGAMALAVFVVANDFTAMNVVLPTLEQELDTNLSTVQWVVNGYSLIFGVLIVPGGRLADLFGRQRVFVWGALIFAGFSLLGGLAPSIGLLIVARILMGIGGAMMWPAILGLMYAILPESKAGLAGGLVIGVAGIGNAAGPVIAGALAEVDWRYIFFLNVPIALIAIVATKRFVHVEAEREDAPIDYTGAALLTVGLLALLGTLTVAPELGYGDPVVVAGFVVFVVAMIAFVARERSAGEGGLVPPSVVANRPFMWACLAVLAMSAIFFATLFYLPQFFQKILGEDTLMAGLMLLPFVATFALVSFSQNWFLERVGMKAVIVTGATGLFVGPLLFATLIDDASGYSAVVPGMIVLGIGVGFFYSSVTTAGLTSLDPSRSSLAGGLLYMCQIAGGAVGLAICTTVFLEVSSSQIDSDATALGVSLQPGEITDIQGVLAGTDTSAELLSAYPDQSTQLTEIVRDAFVSGMRWTFVLTVVLAAIGLVISILKVGGPISSFGRTQAEIDEVTTLPDAVVGADAADTDSADAVGVAPHPAHRVWHPHRHRHVP